jgi:choline dehydrogenase-like flavoprotein
VRPAHPLRGVGKNLTDHLNTNVHTRLLKPISYNGMQKFPKMIRPGLEFLVYRTGPAVSCIVEGGGFFKSPGSDRPDMQIHIAPAFVVRGGQTEMPGHGFTINSTFLLPESRGWVRLRSSDPTAEPLINPNYLAEAKDREMVLTQVRTIREVLSQPEMRPFIKEEVLPGPKATSDADIMAYARSYASCDYHPVASCRMGPDEMAVVDDQLRVRGLEGLRVIDSSIFPRLTAGNTMAPTMMIAEKGADLVKGKNLPS